MNWKILPREKHELNCYKKMHRIAKRTHSVSCRHFEKYIKIDFALGKIFKVHKVISNARLLIMELFDSYKLCTAVTIKIFCNYLF